MSDENLDVSIDTDTSAAMESLISALVHTVCYVGFDTLPFEPGWSWYDALAEHAPEELKAMTPRPEEVVFRHRYLPDTRACTCDDWTPSEGVAAERSHAWHVWEKLQRHGVKGPGVARP